MRKILVTGGLGLIGAEFCDVLQNSGVETDSFDLKGSRVRGLFGDIMDLDVLRDRVRGCDGVVHLAAVSRVATGERAPAECWSQNVDGTVNVLKAVAEQPSDKRPWVAFASSREVYGSPARLPVTEDAPLQPVNAYGRSKAAAEGLINQARGAGMKTAIARFANVYGSVSDYPDRVVPAFARAAANGANIYIEGASHTFDFTSVHDVARGLATLCESLASERNELPPVHFASGRATTIGELAEMARTAGQAQTAIEHRPGRSFDVDHFVGDTRRARDLFGWQVTTTLESGVQRLVNEFAALGDGRPERATHGVSA